MNEYSESVSFEADIRPLFRQRDINAMKSHFDLSLYDDVKANADAIYAELSGGSMPCDGAWPQSQVELFKSWMDGGYAP